MPRSPSLAPHVALDPPSMPRPNLLGSDAAAVRSDLVIDRKAFGLLDPSEPGDSTRDEDRVKLDATTTHAQRG